MEMGDCKRNVSPKLDKACIDGDSEELGEDVKVLIFSAYSVCCISQRKDIQSTGQMRTKLKKSDSVGG